MMAISVQVIGEPLSFRDSTSCQTDHLWIATRLEGRGAVNSDHDFLLI